MNEQELKETIDNTVKAITKDNSWKKTYDKMAILLLDIRELLKQFYKQCKDYKHLQFYLKEITSPDPILIKITVMYQGQPVADVTIDQEGKATVTTQAYDESNKKIYNCKLQLQGEEWNTDQVNQFMEYFSQDLEPKGKIDEHAHIENMLLQEFSKQNAKEKILLGIQPTKLEGIINPLPVLFNGAEPSYINVLCRSKIRKLSVIKVLEDDETLQSALKKATEQAVFLTQLLHYENGHLWHKIFGFKSSVPSHTTVKVCIAMNKKSAKKDDEITPFPLKCESDCLQYHALYYETDGKQITAIKTTLNN